MPITRIPPRDFNPASAPFSGVPGQAVHVSQLPIEMQMARLPLMGATGFEPLGPFQWEDRGSPAMIQLGQSNAFVSGDFGGNLPGSSGSQGSAIVDLIAKGIDLTTQIVRGRQGNVVMNQLPSVPAAIGPAIVGGVAGGVGGAIAQKGIDLFIGGGPKTKGYYNKQGKFINRKRPSMNVTNPHALRRSMRRVEGFAKMAKRTISFTHRVRMKKRGKR